MSTPEEHAGDNGISVGGSNNIIERTVTAFNRDSGLQISRADSSTSISGQGLGLSWQKRAKSAASALGRMARLPCT